MDLDAIRWYHGDTIAPMALTLRTDEALEKALDDLTAQTGASRQAVIRRAILDLHARSGHSARVQDALDASIDRWGDVLDRLGSA